MRELDQILALEKQLKDKPLNPKEQKELSSLQRELRNKVVFVKWSKGYQPTKKDQLEYLRRVKNMRVR